LCDGTLRVWREGRFEGVTLENNPITPTRVSEDQSGLWILDDQGQVLSVAAGLPTSAEVVVAASKLSGSLPSTAGLCALLPDWLVVYNSQGLQAYGPIGGVPRWAENSITEPIKTLVGDPTGSRLVGYNESRVWVLPHEGNGRFTIQELVAGSRAPGPGSVIGVAAGAEESACAVRIGNEIGARVWSMPAAGREAREVIGAPLPPGRETRSVLLAPRCRRARRRVFARESRVERRAV